MTVKTIANTLGITRQTVYNIINNSNHKSHEVVMDLLDAEEKVGRVHGTNSLREAILDKLEKLSTKDLVFLLNEYYKTKEEK